MFKGYKAVHKTQSIKILFGMYFACYKYVDENKK